MSTTLYEASVASIGDAVRKGVAMLGEAKAEQVDDWQGAPPDAPFPSGTVELFVSLGRDGWRCPVAVHMVLTVQLRPVSDMDKHLAEGGR